MHTGIMDGKLKTCTLRVFGVFLFKIFLEDISQSFWGATDIPVLDFW